MIGVPAPCQENMKSQASCPLQWSNPPRTTQRTILSHMRHASQSWTTQHPHITLQTRTGRAYLQLITTILDLHRSDHNGSGDGWSFPAVCFSALTSAQSSGFKNNPYHYLSLIGLQNLLRFSNHVGLFLAPSTSHSQISPEIFWIQTSSPILCTSLLLLPYFLLGEGNHPGLLVCIIPHWEKIPLFSFMKAHFISYF